MRAQPLGTDSNKRRADVPSRLQPGVMLPLIAVMAHRLCVAIYVGGITVCGKLPAAFVGASPFLPVAEEPDYTLSLAGTSLNFGRLRSEWGLVA